MVKLELISKDKNKATFVLKNATVAYANALRRTILGSVPVMAIENLEIVKNSSALYDEMIAHRLGLVPLTTDLSSYELPTSEEDITEKSAKCVVQMTLKEKGPKTVYASDLKTTDPKIKPVYPKLPIVKLLKDQELEFIAYAVLGKGHEHMKWSPGHVWYTYDAKLKINNKHSDFEKFKGLFPPDAFNKKGELDEKIILEKGLVDAVNSVNPEIVEVTYDDTSFIFNVESWGQLSVEEIVSVAIDALDSKLDELKKLI